MIINLKFESIMKIIDVNKKTKKNISPELPQLTFKKIKMSIDKDVLHIKITVPYLENDNYYAEVKDGTLKISLMTKQLVVDNCMKGVTKTKLKNTFLTGFLVIPYGKYKHIKSVKKVLDSLVFELTEHNFDQVVYMQSQTMEYASA